MMDRLLKGKWMILIVVALFLLITSCASAPPAEEKKMIPADHAADLTGMWKMNEDWKGCGRVGKETYTLKITQEGNKVTVFIVESNATYNGIILKDNILAIKGYTVKPKPGGTSTVDDHNLTISPDGNTLKGKLKWHSSYGCDSSSYVKHVRKPKK
jgi:hypothetical protein